MQTFFNFEAALLIFSQALLVCCRHTSILLNVARRGWIKDHFGPAVIFAIRTGVPALSEASLKALTQHVHVFVPLFSSQQISNEAVPGICKLIVHSQHLSIRVHALKCLGKVLPFLEEIIVIKMVLPTLRVLRDKDHTPAVVMCTLGCYDVIAKQLQQSSLARHVLPGIVPLLDEKSLNIKQFEMIVTRVQSILNRVVVGRRSEMENINHSIDSTRTDLLHGTGQASVPQPQSTSLQDSFDTLSSLGSASSNSIAPTSSSISCTSATSKLHFEHTNSYERSCSQRQGKTAASPETKLIKMTERTQEVSTSYLRQSEIHVRASDSQITFAGVDDLSKCETPSVEQQMAETQRQIEILQSQLQSSEDPFFGL